MPLGGTFLSHPDDTTRKHLKDIFPGHLVNPITSCSTSMMGCLSLALTLTPSTGASNLNLSGSTGCSLTNICSVGCGPTRKLSILFTVIPDIDLLDMVTNRFRRFLLNLSNTSMVKLSILFLHSHLWSRSNRAGRPSRTREMGPSKMTKFTII